MKQLPNAVRATSGGAAPPPRRAGLLLAALLALAVAGCATPTPPQALQAAVLQQVAPREPALAAGLPPVDTTVQALLARGPLSADEAVRIALLHSPAARALWAELQQADAEAALAGAPPGLHLALARLRQGEAREVERLLRLDLLALLSWPARAGAATARADAARLATAQALLELAAETRRAWVQAVAAAQTAGYLRDALDAADAAAELALRMAQVGHWPRLRLAQHQQVRMEAAQRLARAEHEALAARERLTRRLGLWGADTQYTLPPRLPALPETLPADRADGRAIEAQALRDRLDLAAARAELAAALRAAGVDRDLGWVGGIGFGLIHNTHVDDHGDRETTGGGEIELALPLAGPATAARSDARTALAHARLEQRAVEARSQVREAWHGWRTAHALARQAQAQRLPLARLVADETLLRYNGMLASVWEVLDRTREQILAVTDAIAAERDFWLADIDLHQALTGAAPQGGAPATAAAAGTRTGPEGH